MTFRALVQLVSTVYAHEGMPVSIPLNSVEDEHDTTVKHVEVAKVSLVRPGRDPAIIRHPHRLQHRLLPIPASALDCRDRIHDTQRQNPFHRSRNQAKRKRLRMVLVPSLHIESQQTSKKHQHSPPSLPKLHSRRKKQNLQASIQRINAMIEQLAQRSRLLRPSRLRAVNSVESLIKKQPDRPRRVDPARAFLVKGGCVVEHSQDVDEDESEAGERDSVRSHGERELSGMISLILRDGLYPLDLRA